MNRKSEKRPDCEQACIPSSTLPLIFCLVLFNEHFKSNISGAFSHMGERQLRNYPHSKLQNYEDSTSPFIHYMSGEALPSTNSLRPDRPVTARTPVTSSSKNPRTGGIWQIHRRTFLYDESLGRSWVSVYTAAVQQNFVINQQPCWGRGC